MSPFNATDQWDFDQVDHAADILDYHWSNYFTESDVEQIAAWGFNTIRIPIGFWAFNNTGTPYISGADAYLEKALGWCRNHGIKALICAHGLPGSQNGFDNSGHRGSANWITSDGDELQMSLDVLETMVEKYGTTSWSDVVWGLELVNEPVVWDTSSFGDVTSWAKSAFDALTGIAGNANLKIIMHDAFVGASNWEPIGAAINEGCDESNFYLDLHLYQNQGVDDSQLQYSDHIQKVCDYKTSQFLPNSTSLPILVGEFSDEINICVDANGVITPGVSCSTTGCQCAANTDTSQWNKYLVNATRKFFETELDVFEKYSEGWFMWSYQGPGAWGMQNLFKYGIIGPNNINERQFPNQCS
ncbi:hypothetical protein AAFC00_000249 [Neodothiora populina]|uniref:glucan 1,3-beta-glucosidase n=1 Tax=Neodothiora populina TaxID=2781224 RepID=A0ABR3P1W7_9PEZI